MSERSFSNDVPEDWKISRDSSGGGDDNSEAGSVRKALEVGGTTDIGTAEGDRGR